MPIFIAFIVSFLGTLAGAAFIHQAEVWQENEKAFVACYKDVCNNSGGEFFGSGTHGVGCVFQDRNQQETFKKALKARNNCRS